MKGFLFSAVLGFVAMALVNLCGPYTGVFLPVSRLSVSGFRGIGNSRRHSDAPAQCYFIELNFDRMARKRPGGMPVDKEKDVQR